MKSNKLRVIILVLVGIIFIWLSQFANVLWGKLGEGSDPFFFPAAFVSAAIYGWLSRNYFATFLVGFLSVPYLIPCPPFQSGSVIYNFSMSIFNQTNYNLLDLVIFLGFGVVAGILGMGFVKLAKRRNRANRKVGETK